MGAVHAGGFCHPSRRATIDLASTDADESFKKLGPAVTASIQANEGANRFYLDTNGNGRWDGAASGDSLIAYGAVGDIPVIGDWNGDGTDDIGVYRPSQAVFYLDANGNQSWDGPTTDRLLRFGAIGDTPINGDWNGDGRDDIGVHRANDFYLDRNGNGQWDHGDNAYRFGNPGDRPIIGDWNGDGQDDIGVHRGSQFFRDTNGNRGWDGVAGGDEVDRLGANGDMPIVGKWRVSNPAALVDVLQLTDNQSSAATIAEQTSLGRLDEITSPQFQMQINSLSQTRSHGDKSFPLQQTSSLTAANRAFGDQMDLALEQLSHQLQLTDTEPSNDLQNATFDWDELANIDPALLLLADESL